MTTKLDIFGRFEEKTIGFIARHKWAIHFAAFPAVVITTVALAFILLAGQIGYTLVIAMLSSANVGMTDITIPVANMTADDETIELWVTVINPVATFFFNWVWAITALLAITYIGASVYVISRHVYRWRKAKNDPA